MSSKPSVLVVDDSPDGREMLVEYLAFRRFQVVEARDGAEALEVARRIQPTIILYRTVDRAGRFPQWTPKTAINRHLKTGN
jgi:PleD family two-component response regulator